MNKPTCARRRVACIQRTGRKGGGGEACSSSTYGYREEAMLVVCGEPAVNRMKAGSTVQYSEKKKKGSKKRAAEVAKSRN